MLNILVIYLYISCHRLFALDLLQSPILLTHSDLQGQEDKGEKEKKEGEEEDEDEEEGEDAEEEPSDDDYYQVCKEHILMLCLYCFVLL